jgi:hypothetical protein
MEYILPTLTLLMVALAVWRVLESRRPGSRTLMQILIFGLYGWARWWMCFATAMDAGYLRFRMEARLCVIEPENEEVGRCS